MRRKSLALAILPIAIGAEGEDHPEVGAMGTQQFQGRLPEVDQSREGVVVLYKGVGRRFVAVGHHHLGPLGEAIEVRGAEREEKHIGLRQHFGAGVQMVGHKRAALRAGVAHESSRVQPTAPKPVAPLEEEIVGRR